MLNGYVFGENKTDGKQDPLNVKEMQIYVAKCCLTQSSSPSDTRKVSEEVAGAKTEYEVR